MPVNSIHNLTFSGEFCSVPVSISLAYKQLADDPVGVNTGVNLIQKWFDEPAAFGGAWRTIRPFLSDELGFACATDSYDSTAVSAFLNGATGLNPDPATPSPLALQVEVQPQNPHPLGRPGRFFMPGFTNNQLERAGLDDATTQALLQFYLKLLEVEDLGGGQGPRYHLIPHAGFRDRAGTVNDILAYKPFGNLMIKVIGSRRSDACQAFLSGGDKGGFEQIQVPPGAASIAITGGLPGGTGTIGDPPQTWSVQTENWDPIEVQISTELNWDSGNFIDLAAQGSGLWTKLDGVDWIGVGTKNLYPLGRDINGQLLTGAAFEVTISAS